VGGTKEYETEKRIYGKRIIVYHIILYSACGKRVRRSMYTVRENWRFSTSPPPPLCTSHRSGKIIAATDVKFDRDKVRGPKVMCAEVYTRIQYNYRMAFSVQIGVISDYGGHTRTHARLMDRIFYYFRQFSISTAPTPRERCMREPH